MSDDTYLPIKDWLMLLEVLGVWVGKTMTEKTFKDYYDENHSD